MIHRGLAQTGKGLADGTRDARAREKPDPHPAVRQTDDGPVIGEKLYRPVEEKVFHFLDTLS